MPRVKHKMSARRQKTSEHKRALIQSRAAYASRLPIMNKIERLSYRQLLRVSAIIDARDISEIKEAMNFVRSLTPPERQIIRQYEAITAGSPLREKVRRALADTIKCRNEQEIKEMNGQLLLENVMKD